MQSIKLTSNDLRAIIQEERRVLEAHAILEKTLQTEARRLQLEGKTPAEINEGIMDFFGTILSGVGGLFKNLPGGVRDVVVNKVVRWLCGKLGLNPDGIAAKALANVIEEIEISNLGFYFSAKGCDDFAERLAQALGETIADEAIDKIIIDVMGVVEDPNGLVYMSLRESLTNMLGSTDFAMAGKSQLADFVCELGPQLGSLLAGLPIVGGMFGGGEPEAEPATGEDASVDDVAEDEPEEVLTPEDENGV